jgi:hypothetical protein
MSRDDVGLFGEGEGTAGVRLDNIDGVSSHRVTGTVSVRTSPTDPKGPRTNPSLVGTHTDTKTAHKPNTATKAELLKRAETAEQALMAALRANVDLVHSNTQLLVENHRLAQVVIRMSSQLPSKLVGNA